jgi:hypothetical protein
MSLLKVLMEAGEGADLTTEMSEPRRRAKLLRKEDEEERTHSRSEEKIINT